MNKRINIMLSVVTIALLENLIPKGDRSKFIDEAIRFYISKKTKDNLRKELIRCYSDPERNALDLELAEEWFHVSSPIDEL